MKKALIVVDMQNDFITGSLGSAQAQAIVANVCRKIEAFDGEIFYTRDTHEQATYMQTTEGKNLPVMHCIKDTDSWAIEARVQSALRAKFADEDTFRAHGIDKACFGSPLLAEKVIAEGISCVELIGLCTDVCVISNAVLLRNQHPNMCVTVDASCCAGVTPESHATALAAMKSCGIYIIGETC